MAFRTNMLLAATTAIALAIAGPALSQTVTAQGTDQGGDAMKAPGTDPVQGGDPRAVPSSERPATPGGAMQTQGTPGADWVPAPSTGYSNSLIGADVVNAQNETIGEVENVFIQENRTMLLVSVGAFLGIGERTVAVDRDTTTIYHKVDDPNDLRVSVNMTREQLEMLPEYDPSTATPR